MVEVKQSLNRRFGANTHSANSLLESVLAPNFSGCEPSLLFMKRRMWKILNVAHRCEHTQTPSERQTSL